MRDVKRVLIVDDEPAIRRSVRRLLGRHGLEVEEAESGEDALALFQEYRYDVVICDLAMPGMSGAAGHAAIRTSVDPPAFIYMSGHAGPSEVATAFRNGAVDFLVKPFHGEQLDSALHRALGAPIRPSGDAPNPAPETGNGDGLGTRHEREPPAGTTVALFDAVTSGDQAPMPRPALTRITNWTRVLETLRRAVKGRHARLLLDGCDDEQIVVVSALTSHLGRGYSGAVAIQVTRLRGDFVDLPWARGGGCVVWFADVEGIHGFRTTIVGGNRTQLVLGQPDCVVRYSRRQYDRTVGSVLDPICTAVLLSDGSTWNDIGRVLDLSVGGAALRLPARLSPRVGATIRLGLGLKPGGRLMSLSAIIRRLVEDGDDLICGLEFTALTPTNRTILQRFTEQHRPTPEEALSDETLPPTIPTSAVRIAD